ncbi:MULTISPECIES: arsenate reductase ArsC [Halomonas]|uniref:Protein-tyrosine-phosphatase n=2 Tax=Halomonas TaxID=2745 RepID=A0ABQ0U0Z6_9GAMM|nr:MULTISPECIES: arsenate reductase ArsC [Halomonas]KGE76844.1 protein tyrosine phosphatase [Halomonas salina]MDR5888055.1 arsenate reductase ArsC [Halomonas salina]RAH37464.1 arsenate reductase ArsC [Halomonas sp. SL1]WJY08579.1 arsenate reductase ArsC [Halomonas halophila]GEK72211.1 protein-tyrosine-phosphatase [Halomonas halophila]
MTRRRILFLCNANSARSLMGEALLRHLAGDRFEAFSAGSEPDRPHEMALAALHKQGIDTQGLASKSLEAFAGERFDTVIVLCDKARQACRDWTGEVDERLDWDIRDPRLIEREQAYEQALQEIRHRLQLWLDAQH